MINEAITNRRGTGENTISKRVLQTPDNRLLIPRVKAQPDRLCEAVELEEEALVNLHLVSNQA